MKTLDIKWKPKTGEKIIVDGIGTCVFARMYGTKSALVVKPDGRMECISQSIIFRMVE